MDREYFIHKWNKRGGLSGLRIILFDGGSIFADNMEIVLITQQGDVGEIIDDYEEVHFSKNLGVLVETGVIRLDKIKEVL